MTVYYMRTDNLDDIEDAIGAGYVVVVHKTARYAYLKGVRPVAEVLATSLNDLPANIRKCFVRKHIRRQIVTTLEDGTEQVETVEMAVLPNDVQEGDEVLGEYEAAKFGGE